MQKLTTTGQAKVERGLKARGAADEDSDYEYRNKVPFFFFFLGFVCGQALKGLKCHLPYLCCGGGEYLPVLDSWAERK